MKKLTNGKFKFGAVSCELLDKFWRKGKAPTYQEFANKYSLEIPKEAYHPEWRYIIFLRNGGTIEECSDERKKISKKVIKVVISLFKILNLEKKE